MTIHLPDELQSRLRAEVLKGRFASEDEAVVSIVRDYLHHKPEALATLGDPAANDGLGSIGALREDAELLDAAVEIAMQARESRPWRLGPGE